MFMFLLLLSVADFVGGVCCHVIVVGVVDCIVLLYFVVYVSYVYYYLYFYYSIYIYIYIYMCVCVCGIIYMMVSLLWSYILCCYLYLLCLFLV